MELHCQSLEDRLPLKTASIDAAIMLGVLEFINNIALVAQEVGILVGERGHALHMICSSATWCMVHGAWYSIVHGAWYSMVHMICSSAALFEIYNA